MNKTLLVPEDWPLRARQLLAEYARRRAQKSRHARDHLRQLHRFLQFQSKHGASFRDFSKTVVYGYLVGFTARQARHWLTILRPWMRFLFQRKELLQPHHEDFSGAHLPLYGRRAALTYEQVLIVLNLPPLDTPQGLRDRALLEMAYGTGMRKGELLALDLGDLDLGEGFVFVKDSKNNRQRKVPLTGWARHFLRRYLEESRPQLTSPLSSNTLWLNRYGTRLYRTAINLRLKKYYHVRKALGGVPFAFHQLRHSAATHLLVAGAPLVVVKELLGHSCIESTAIYTHLTPAHLLEMHHRFHPRNSPEWAGVFSVAENPVG